MGNSSKKLTIKGYLNNEFSKTSLEFSVLVNPERFGQDFNIEYSEEEVIGSVGAKANRFKRSPSSSLNFEIFLDDTGAIPVPKNIEDKPLTDRIDQLMNVLYKINDTTHEPNFIEIIWGTFFFRGRTTSIKVEYTMFKPDGTPLRAKVSLGFKSYVSTQQDANEQKLNSPDLTHIVTVQPGDTLPYLCDKIYNDSSYYVYIAQFNKLIDFRNIAAGTEIIFPPII
ncbi:MAG: hypothetical protein MI784_03035 [Cytophagales bacterium]|nr:hypothetical protein [Cytophagales bacterium]